MLLEMLVKEPNDVFLNYALALEMSAVADYAAAEKYLLKTKDLQADYIPCYYQLGQIAEKTNKPENALKYYHKGAELAKLQNNQKALNEFNEAIWLLEE